MERANERNVRDLVTVAVVLVASVVVRAVFLDEYRFEGMGRDTAGYLDVAQNIAGGLGWVSHSVRFLFLLPETLPHPDSYWSPLFPLTIAGVFKVLGPGFEAARVVPFAFGLLVPVLVYRLVRDTAQSWRAGLAGGVIAAFHPTLVMWSLRVQPEIVSIFFVTLTLWLLVGERVPRRPWLLGASLGLAYLCKYQNLILWVPVFIFYACHRPRRDTLRDIARAAAAFAIVALPWWIRNAIVFGDPFHAAVRSTVLSYYPEMGGETRMSASLEPPPPAIPYLLSHPVAVLAQVKHGLRLLVSDFLIHFGGGVSLFVMAVLGVPAAVGRWRRWLPAGGFALVLLLLFAATVPLVRFTMVLVPVWVALAGAGAGYLASGGALFPRVRTALAVLVVLLCVAGGVRSVARTVADKDAMWTPSANFGVLEAQSVAAFVQAHTASDEVVFAAHPYHYALILGRSVVQFPFEDDALLALRDRYRIRYLVTSDRDWKRRFPQWVDTGPPWAWLVEAIPADEIARPPRNPGYPNVHAMRVYRLHDPPDGGG
jgi:4-amino-4-deoxy-L-arabinose transferase-like glycosyltransferase